VPANSLVLAVSSSVVASGGHRRARRRRAGGRQTASAMPWSASGTNYWAGIILIIIFR
jgi:hypothetical protein